MSKQSLPVLPNPGRCSCGATGTWRRSVLGTDGGRPVAWAGCPYCPGTAVLPNVPLDVWERATAAP